MHALARPIKRAQEEADWPTYVRAMRLADALWLRPTPDLLNALHVSFLEHLEFRGLDGELAWSRLSSGLQEGRRAMDASGVTRQFVGTLASGTRRLAD